MATEVIETMLSNVPTALVVAVAVGLLRNITGWYENAMKDGKVDDYEIKQLIGTMVKYFSGVMLLMVGLPVEEAVVGVFGLDVVTSAIKSAKKEC